MQYTYYPKGTCSTQYDFEIEDGVIKDVTILNGCSGNLQGIRKLIIGMNVQEVVERLDGIHCGPRPTSCPDQIAQALKQYIQENQTN